MNQQKPEGTLEVEKLSAHAHEDRELFDRIADTYARKDTVPSSRLARQQRLRQTMRIIGMPVESTLLEVGCGAGYAAEYLRGRFNTFVGIDYSEKLIAFARQRHDRPGVRFEVADLSHYRMDPAPDVVFMIGVLHHVDDMAGALKHMVELVRPGGWIVANEPQPNNPVVQALRWLRKRLDTTYSDDQRTLSGKQLATMYRKAGLQDVRIKGQGLLSTPFAEVPLPCQPISGLLSGASCLADRLLETVLCQLTRYVCWNVIVAGRRPTD